MKNKFSWLKNKMWWLLNVTIRYFILDIRIFFLRKILGMTIGEGTKISLKSNLDKTNPKGVVIGNYSYLAFGSTILTHDMARNLHSSVIIGDCCFIGANSLILPGVNLGNNVVVAAGAVVTKSFSDNVLIAGNPAKIIKPVSTGKLGIIKNT